MPNLPQQPEGAETPPIYSSDLVQIEFGHLMYAVKKLSYTQQKTFLTETRVKYPTLFNQIQRTLAENAPEIKPGDGGRTVDRGSGIVKDFV